VNGNLNKISVAIVGAGYIANTVHIPVWRKIKGVDLTAIYDIDKERAEKTARKWRIPRIYTDFAKLLEEENEVIIDICTPPSTHVSLSVEAMRMGHSVVLEKPMAMSYEECKKIMDEYQKRKHEVRLCIIHNFLFTPPLLEIKSIINKKHIDILSVDIRMLHTPNDEMISDKNHWVHKLPGGRFGENLIHPIYILQNLIGRLNVRDIYTSKRGSYDWVKFDELFATFDSEGKYGTIHISFNSPRATNAPLSIRVYGKQLIINYDGSNLTLITQGSLPQGAIWKVKDNLTLITQIAKSLIKGTIQKTIRTVLGKNDTGHEYLFTSFIQSILENREMPYTPEEAYDATITFLEVLQRIENIKFKSNTLT
jgi:predicted dehydrogenase